MFVSLFNNIIKSEIIAADWSKMIITPIFQKSNKLNPGNYRAISLLSIPSKVFCKILIQRCLEKTEDYLSKTQFGFRAGKGTVDAIFVVRQIIEKAKEHNVSLHFNFIDFKAAFDMIWREALWKIMLHVGIHQKIVTLMKQIYEDTKCTVQIGGKLTDFFPVKVGVRQGCIMSPTLVNIYLDYIMREIKCLDKQLELNGKMVTDIRYADDTTFISAVFQKLELATSELEKTCAKWGLKSIQTNVPY